MELKDTDQLIKPYLTTIKEQVGAQEIVGCENIQTLWSGYGGIYRVHLMGASKYTVVVKCIDLQGKADHPRGWSTNRSHQRKLKSYQVEQYWYESVSYQLPDRIKVPQVIWATHQGEKQVIVMEDIAVAFPLLRNRCTFVEAKSVINWLAHFHAFFLNYTSKGLWPTGTYWHLETRPDEWQLMEASLLKDKAEQIDNMLNHAKYKTLVHGDAKVANFCFNRSGSSVAAVDFQYVGGGVGVKDVAYFLGSCLNEEECELYEKDLLNIYFEELRKRLKLSVEEKIELEVEWRKLYPLAWADFNRFLLGWLPTHHKLHDFALRKNKEAYLVLN